MVLLGVLAVVAVIWLLGTRANELFCLSVRDGRVLVVRGRVPAGLLADLKDALKDTRRATVRAHKTPQGARLSTSGVDEFHEQRLRNIFHVYPQSRLAAAEPLNRKNLGQLLGIAWLAWLFVGRGE